jgi:YfiR/HmsC-like
MSRAAAADGAAPCRVTTQLETVMRFAYRGCLSLMALCAIVQCRAQASAPVDADVATTVVGIVHFARWPDRPATLHLCVADADARTADELAHAFAQAGGDERKVIVTSRSLSGSAADALLDCQVLYVGAAAPDTYRPTLVRMAGRPILTIGAGDDFCSFGGLFCVERSGDATRIKANLDSIAGSGLRVNPQLLRLTQRGAKDPK